MKALSPDHLEDLRRSGLTDDTITVMQCEAVPPNEVPIKAAQSAYRLPYFDLAGTPNCFTRLRLVPAVMDTQGHKMKYWQPKDSVPHLYLPPLLDWRPVAKDSATPFTVTEGEKKAAAACQHGLVTVGIGGVWNWTATLDSGDTLTLPLLDEFHWTSRPVSICPDSDAWHEGKGWQILAGFFALAKDLQQRGADVKFVVLPDLHGRKAGLDDWLLIPGNDVVHGWPMLDRMALDHSRFGALNAWWQKWKGKRISRQAIHHLDASDFVLTEVVGLFRMAIAKHGVVFTFDRLHEQRGAYHAELTVTLSTTEILDTIAVSLSSDAAQVKLANSLKTYSDQIPWKVLLQKSCALVIRRHRQGEPPAHLNRNSTVEALTYAVNPLVPRKKPTILFADGGKGKSTFALMMAMAVSTGQSVAGFSALAGKPLFLDWEDDLDVHTRRLHAIRAGHPALDAADVQYQRCCEPLVKLTHELARTIQRENITFVIIDSLLAAMGGDSSAEAVGKFFAALRVLQVESLLIGHTPKTLPEGQENPTVYGSVFNQNFARGVWELKTEQELGEESAILGLFHRKSNLTRKHLPIGLKVTHKQDGTSVRYEPFDLTNAAELEKALPLPSRIRNLLDSDGIPRSSEQIAKELGLETKLGSVKTTLSRHKGFKWSLLSEGKDTKWTTISSGK